MLIYILGILVLIFIHYECYRLIKKHESIKKQDKIKETVTQKKMEEYKQIPIKKTKHTLGIFIGYDYDIEFSDLSNSETIKYIESSFQFTQSFILLNEEFDLKNKINLIIKTFHELYPIIEDDENLVFLWICSVSTFAQTKSNKKYEKVIKLGNDYLYESDLNQLFLKYSSSKFVCGFQTLFSFMPNLCIIIEDKIKTLEEKEKKEVDKEKVPDKKEYKEELKDFSIIVPYQLNYKEKVFKKIQIEFYEISEILQKTLDWKFNFEFDKTNQFVWCLNGENLSKMFVLYLQVLGYDTPLESISSYLIGNDIKQSFGKLFPSQYQFSSLFK